MPSHSTSSFPLIRPVCAALLLGVAVGRGVIPTSAVGAPLPVSDIPPAGLSEGAKEADGRSDKIRIVINGRADRLEADSATRAAARELLPVQFREFESPHFVVISDADAEHVQRLQERLERAHDEFMRFSRRAKLKPEPLRHKLVTVLFAERADYRAFAQAQDAVTDPTVAGYYAPSHDRAVFYDARTNPSVIDAERALDEMQDDLRDLGEEAREADRANNANEREILRSHLANYEAHYRRERAKLERFIRQIEAATTVHEAVHQLLYHTGIQSRQLEYPVWIAEGLATTFETDNTSQLFGPDRDYEPRRDAFIDLLDRDELLPLETLIAITPAGLAEHNAKEVYHQSYAFTRWLLRYRPEGMREYLKQLIDEAPGQPTPARLHELFESCFGPVSTLENRWLRDERRTSADVRLVRSPDVEDDGD